MPARDIKIQVTVIRVIMRFATMETRKTDRLDLASVIQNNSSSLPPQNRANRTAGWCPAFRE